MIKVVLADDHPIVRKGIQAMLSLEADIEIIGEASDGLEALNIVEKLQPDILVLDLTMKGINGLEVTRQLGKSNSRTHVIIHSMHNNESYVLDALKYGARGYILKDNTDEDLVPAIREVASGHHFLSKSLSERAIEVYIRDAEAKPADPYEQLSTREREIFQLAAQGMNNAEIAARFFISARTVETHRGNAMRKLGIHSRAELIHYAARRGFLPDEKLS